MSIYGRWILPRLIDWTMRAEDLAPYRERLVPRARGRVLEVGVGSGLNLPLYGPGVEQVVGLDPSAELLRRAAPLAARAAVPVHLVRAAAEAIPLADRSVDTVVMAWTLCSLGDARAGLAEMRRVLRPGGALLFVEHGLAPEPGVAAWQHRLDPLWVRISCHLDNPVDRILREAGFEVVELASGYLGRGPKPMTFLYEGRARPAADPWASGPPGAWAGPDPTRRAGPSGAAVS
ncbi:methyltransferase [Caldovatus sediminis]|uniref:Methyltransferase n=1 Tax=Caldovatus sediminis TaxID=2041189 RepID=A0A8J3EEF0_9PROT|nr:class I SAM-dependent methyltransferase [Caldovatus sediminis]GGG52399.1 methyltransferase [Caldovatus sediminis]